MMAPNELDTMMRTLAFLPLLTYPDASSAKFVINAMAIVKYLDAQLDVQSILVDIPDVSNALSGILLDLPKMIREAEHKSRTAGLNLLATVKQAAAEAEIIVSTEETTAPLAGLAEVAALRARYCDIALMEWSSVTSMAREVAEEVLFESGRPIMLLPASETIDAVDHVMIAWDGTRVAARAVADAQPFLQSAKRISIVTVLDEKPIYDKSTGERLALTLKRRGLDVNTANREVCGAWACAAATTRTFGPGILSLFV
jgi:hypothetical protein